MERLDVHGAAVPHSVFELERWSGRRRGAVGFAVLVLAESGLRPGMRVLDAADGFPELPSCQIGLVRNAHESSPLADALAEHIILSLDNLSEAAIRRRSRYAPRRLGDAAPERRRPSRRQARQRPAELQR